MDHLLTPEQQHIIDNILEHYYSMDPLLTPEQQRVLDDILERFDEDNDGIVSLAEIVAEFDTIGDPATAQTLKDLTMADWDTNRDNTLSTAELREMAIRWASFPGDQSKPRPLVGLDA